MNIDVKIIELFDRLLGLAEARGVTLPRVLLEARSAELVTGFSLPVTALLGGGTWTAAVFALVTASHAVFLLSTMKPLREDLKREWTPEMAQRYAKRAMIIREVNAWHRMWHLMLALTVIALLLSTTAEALDFAIILWFLVSFIRMYSDCAVPLPPKRRTEFKPAFGQA